MKVKKILVGAGILQMILGIILLVILLLSTETPVMAWISTILLLLFGLSETIIAAIGSN